MKKVAVITLVVILIVLFLVSGCALRGEATASIAPQSGVDGTPMARAAGSTEEHYVYGAGLEAKYSEDGLKYIHQDVLGSSRAVTDETGNLAESNTHLPYGQNLGESEERFTFTGKEAEGDLMYFGARYYDKDIGRFISVDPIKDGTHWYGYANNNPLKYVDPTGLVSIPFEVRTDTYMGGHTLNPDQINEFISFLEAAPDSLFDPFFPISETIDIYFEDLSDGITGSGYWVEDDIITINPYLVGNRWRDHINPYAYVSAIHELQHAIDARLFERPEAFNVPGDIHSMSVEELGQSLETLKTMYDHICEEEGRAYDTYPRVRAYIQEEGYEQPNRMYIIDNILRDEKGDFFKNVEEDYNRMHYVLWRQQRVLLDRAERERRREAYTPPENVPIGLFIPTGQDIQNDREY